MVGPPFREPTIDDDMETQDSDANPSPAGCLLRLFWMLGGNAVIYLMLAQIGFRGAPLPSAFDAAVAVTLALMITARRVDIVQHRGRTAGDEPATLADWRRYTAVLLLVTAVGWVVAHVAAGNRP